MCQLCAVLSEFPFPWEIQEILKKTVIFWNTFPNLGINLPILYLWMLIVDTYWLSALCEWNYIFCMGQTITILHWLFVLWEIVVLNCNYQLTLKHRETHGSVVSTVATDALVLKHQAISIHNAD